MCHLSTKIPVEDEETCLQLCRIENSVDVRVARTDTPQWLCSTWRRTTSETLEREFKSGERAIHRVIEKLKFEFVDVSSKILLNVNEPQHLKHQH
jgi:molybdopterin-guanine dinucleotide biosynthesis protein A